MGKERFAYFSPICRAFVLLLKENLPVFVFVPFSYKSANEGAIKFLVNLGQFFHLPENMGMRRRIQSWDIKVTPYPCLIVTYHEPSICQF